jgi:hypothetical protein
MGDRMLDALGNTADEVASALRAKGVQGVPNTVRYLNPIVRYVKGQLGDAQTVYVIGDLLTIHFLDGHQQQKTIPPAVRDFLDAFNRGQYPDLYLPASGNP